MDLVRVYHLNLAIPRPSSGLRLSSPKHPIFLYFSEEAAKKRGQPRGPSIKAGSHWSPSGHSRAASSLILGGSWEGPKDRISIRMPQNIGPFQPECWILWFLSAPNWDCRDARGTGSWGISANAGLTIPDMFAVYCASYSKPWGSHNFGGSGSGA